VLVNGAPAEGGRPLRNGDTLAIDDLRMTFACPPDLERLRWPPIDPPSTHVPDVPPQLDRIVMKLLAFSPDERYQTAAELLADLEPLRDGRDVVLERLLGGRALTRDDLTSDAFLRKYMDALGEGDALRALAWIPEASNAPSAKETRATLARRVAEMLGADDATTDMVALAARLCYLGFRRPEADGFMRQSAAIIDREFVRRASRLDPPMFDALVEAVAGCARTPGPADTLGTRILRAICAFVDAVSTGDDIAPRTGEDALAATLRGTQGLDAGVVAALTDCVLSAPLEEKLALVSNDDLRTALAATEIEPALAGLATRLRGQAVDRWARLLGPERTAELRERLAERDVADVSTYVSMREAFCSQMAWAADPGRESRPEPLWGEYVLRGRAPARKQPNVYEATNVVSGKRVLLEMAFNRESDEYFETVSQLLTELTSGSILLPSGRGRGKPHPFRTYDAELMPTLEQTLAESDVPMGTALGWLASVLDALGEVHARGAVHRDVKPQTIWITPGGAKLTGFCIAERIAARRLAEGAVYGTPAYMSPEACRGGEVDARSDLYSLGVVAYRAVTGNVPFDPTDVMKVLEKHAHQKPKAPRAVNASVPAELEAWILKLLAKSPADRYQAADEARAALDEIIGIVDKADPPLACPRSPGE